MFAVAVVPALALLGLCDPMARSPAVGVTYMRPGSTMMAAQSRREVLQLPAAAIGAVAATALSGSRAAVAAEASISTELQLLGIKAKKLRAAVRIGAGNRRKLPFDQTPGVNNYASLTDRVRHTETHRDVAWLHPVRV